MLIPKIGKKRTFIRIIAFIVAQVFFITSLGYAGPDYNSNLRTPMGKANDRIKAVLDAANSLKRTTPALPEAKIIVQVAQAPSLPMISHAQSFNIPYKASGDFGIPKDWQEGMYFSDDKDSIIDNADIRELKNQASYYEEELKTRGVNLQITGMRTSVFTDAHGRKYNFQLHQIKGRLFFIQIFPGKKAQFKDIEIMKALNLALGREDLKDLDLSKPFFILRPQRSAHIYGDCVTNHVMYINRYFDDIYAQLETQQLGSGSVLLQVGLEHEFYHEITGKGMEIEDFLRKKDAQRLVELARNNDGVLQFLITQEIAAQQFEADYIICAMGDKAISDKTKEYCIEKLGGLLDFKRQIKISKEQVNVLIQSMQSVKNDYIVRRLAFCITRALIMDREIKLTLNQLNILFELFPQISPDGPYSYNRDILDAIRSALSNNAQLLQPVIDYYEKNNNPEFTWAIGAALGDNQELVKPVINYFKSASEKIKQGAIHAFEVGLHAEKQVKFDIEDLDVFIQLILEAKGSYRSKLIAVIDMVLEKNQLILNSGQVDILIQALSIENDNSVKTWLASALGHALEADAGLKLTAAQFAILLAILKKSADSSGKFAHAIARAIDNNKELEISPVELEIFLDKNISAATEESKWYFAEVIYVSLENQRSLWLLPEWMNFLIKAINDCKSDESKKWFGRAIGMAIANHEPSLEVVLKRLTTTNQDTQGWLAYAIGIAIANNQALLGPIFEKLKVSKNDKEIEWFASAISVALETNHEIKLTPDQIDSLVAGMDKAVDGAKEQFAKAICNVLKNDKALKLTPPQASLIIRLLSNKTSSHSDKTQLAIILKYAADNDKQFAVSTQQLDAMIAIIPDILDCPDKPLVSVIGIVLANNGVHLPAILKIIESYSDDGVKTWLASALGITITQKQWIGSEIFNKLEQEKETSSDKWLYYAIGIAAAQNEEVFETVVKKLDNSGDKSLAMAYSLSVAISNNTALLSKALLRLETSSERINYNLAHGIGIAIAGREELFETILNKLRASSWNDKNKFFAHAIGIAIRNKHELLDVVIRELSGADDGYKKSLAAAINVNNWDKSMKELKYTPTQFGILIDAVLDPSTSHDTKKQIAEALGNALENNRNFALSLAQIDSFLKIISSAPEHLTDNMYSLAKIIGVAVSHSEGFLQYAFDCFKKGSQNDKRWIAYAIELALKSNKELQLDISWFDVLMADLVNEGSDRTKHAIAMVVATAMIDNKKFIGLIFERLKIASKDSDIFWFIRAIRDAVNNDAKPISLSQEQMDIIIDAMPRAQGNTISWISTVINTALEKNPSLKLSPDQLGILIKAVSGSSKETHESLAKTLKNVLRSNVELKLDKQQLGIVTDAISSAASEYFVEYYGESIAIALDRDKSLTLNMTQIDILIKSMYSLGTHTQGERAAKIAELLISILDKDQTLKLGSSQMNILIEAIIKGYASHYKTLVSRLIGMAAANEPALIQIIFDKVKTSSGDTRWFVEAVATALEKNKNIKLNSAQVDLLIKNIPEPSRYSDDYSVASFAKAISLALKNNQDLKLNIEQVDSLINNISRSAQFITAIRNALESNRAIRLNRSQFDIMRNSASIWSLGSNYMADLSHIIGIAIADNPELTQPILAAGKSADIKIKKCYIDALIIAIKNNQKLIEQIINILKTEPNEDAKSFIANVLYDLLAMDATVELTLEQVDTLIAVTTKSADTVQLLVSAIFSAFENNKAIKVTLPQIKLLIPRLMIISDSAAASNLCRLMANTVAADKNIKLELSDVSALIKTMPKASNLLKIELCRAMRASLENDRRLKISQDELNVLVKNIPIADSKADEYADSSRIEFSQAIAVALKNNKELKLDPARFVELLDISSNDAVTELATVINIIFNNSGSSDKPELTPAQLVTLIKALDASTGKAKEQLAWIIVNMELGNKRKLRLDAGQVEILVKTIIGLSDTVNGKLTYAISEFLRFDKDIDAKFTSPLMDIIFDSIQKAPETSQRTFFGAISFLLNSNFMTSRHLGILIDIFPKSIEGKTTFACSEIIYFILKQHNNLIVDPNRLDILINGIPIAFKGNHRYERYLVDSVSIILENNKELKLTVEQFNILIANACYAKGDLDKEAFVRAIIDSIMNDIELVKPLFSNFRNIEGKDNSWFESVIAGVLASHEELLEYIIQCFDAGSRDANEHFVSAIGNSLAKNPELLKPLFESINAAKGDKKSAIIKAINHGMPRNASLQLTSDQIDALVNTISIEEDESTIEELGSMLSSSIVDSNKKLNQTQIKIIIKSIAKASSYHVKEIFSAALRYAAENDKTLTLSQSQLAMLIQAVDDASNAANATNNCEKQLSYVIGIALLNDVKLFRTVVDGFETVANDQARKWLGEAIKIAVVNNEKLVDYVVSFLIAGLIPEDAKARDYLIQALGNALAENNKALNPMVYLLELHEEAREPLSKAMGIGLAANTKLFEPILNSALKAAGYHQQWFRRAISFGLENNKDVLKAIINNLPPSSDKIETWFAAAIVEAILRNRDFIKTIIAEIPHSSHDKTRQFLSSVIGDALFKDTELLKIIIDSFSALPLESDNKWLMLAIEQALFSGKKELIDPIINFYLSASLTTSIKHTALASISRALAKNNELLSPILERFNKSTDAKEIEVLRVIIAGADSPGLLQPAIEFLKIAPDEGVKNVIISVIAKLLENENAVVNKDQLRVLLEEATLASKEFFSSAIGLCVSREKTKSSLPTSADGRVLSSQELFDLVLTYFEATPNENKELVALVIGVAMDKNKKLKISASQLNMFIGFIPTILSDPSDKKFLRFSAIIKAALKSNPELKLTAAQIEVVIQAVSKTTSATINAGLLDILKSATENDKEMILSANQMRILINAFGFFSMASSRSLCSVIGIALSNDKNLLASVMAGFSIASFGPEEKQWLAEAVGMAISKNQGLVEPVLASFIIDVPADGSEWFGRVLGIAQSLNTKSLQFVLDSFGTTPDPAHKEYLAHSIGVAFANNETFSYPIMEYFKAVYERLNPKPQSQELRIKDAHKCEHIKLKSVPVEIAILPDGNLAIATKKEKSIFIINPITGDVVKEISNIGLIGEVRHIAVIQNGYLAICDTGDLNIKNSSVFIVDPGTGGVVNHITTIKEPACACMLDDTLVIGSNDDDNPLIIINPNTGDVIKQFKKGQFKDSIRQPTDIAVYNGNLIITDFFYNTVAIIDPVTGAIVKQFPGEVNRPTGMSIFDNYLVVTTEFDPLVLFDLKTKKIVRKFTYKELGPSINKPYSIDYLNGKFYIANYSVASMSELELEDIAPVEQIPTTIVVKDYARVKSAREVVLPDSVSLAKLILMPDGNLAGINKKEGAPPIVFLNPETGALIKAPNEDTIAVIPIPPVDIVVIGNQIAIIFEEFIQIVDADTWRVEGVFAHHDLNDSLKNPSCAVAIDNKLIIINGGDNSIVIVDPKNGHAEKITKSQLGHVLNAPQKATVINGKLAILNGGEQSVVIIDPKDWSVIRKLTGSDLEGKLNNPKGIAAIDGMLAIINYFDDSIVLIDPANNWKALKKYTNMELGDAISGPKYLFTVEGALYVLNSKTNSITIVEFQDMELPGKKIDTITPVAHIIGIAVSSNKDCIKFIVDYMENNSQEEFIQIELATVLSDILAKDEEVLNILISRLKAAKAESKQLFIDIIKDSLSKNHRLIQPILKSLEELSHPDKRKLAFAISDVVSSDIELFNFTLEYLSHIPHPATDDTIEESLAAIISIALERNPEIKLMPEQLKVLFDLLALLGSWFNNPAQAVPRSIALYLATAISSALKNNKALKPSSNDFGALLEKLQNSVYITGSNELQAAFSFAAGMCAASNPDILSRLLGYLGGIKVTDNATMNLRNLVISSLTTAINYDNDIIKSFLTSYDTASDELEVAMELVIMQVLTAAPSFLNTLIDYIKTASDDKKTNIIFTIQKAMHINPDIANSFSSQHLEVLIPLIYDAPHSVNTNTLMVIDLALKSKANLRLTFDQLKVVLDVTLFADSDARNVILQVLVHSFSNSEDIIEPMFKYIETVGSNDIQLFFFKAFISGADFTFTEDIVDTIFRIYSSDDTDESVKLKILEFLKKTLFKGSKFNLKASQFNMLIDSIPHYSNIATEFVCSIISEILKNNKALQLNPAQMKILVDELIGKDANLPASREVIKNLATVISNGLQNNPGAIINEEEVAKIMDMIGNTNLPDDIRETLGLAVGRAMVNNKKLYASFFKRLENTNGTTNVVLLMEVAGVVIRNDRMFLEKLIEYFKATSDWQRVSIGDKIYSELEIARNRGAGMEIKLSQPEFDIFLEVMLSSTHGPVFLPISKVINAAMTDNSGLKLSPSQKDMIIVKIDKTNLNVLNMELARIISRVMPEKITIAMAEKKLITGSNMEQIDGILNSLTDNRYYNEVVQGKENYLKTVFNYLEDFILSDKLEYDDIPYLNDSLRILINKDRADLIPTFLARIKQPFPALKKEKIMEFALEVIGLPVSEENMLLSLLPKEKLSTKLQTIGIDILFKEVTATNYKEEEKPYLAYLYLKLRKEMKEMVAGLSYEDFRDIVNDKKADSLFKDMIARFILKEVSSKTIDLSDKDQDTIIYLSIDINDALLKLVTESNGFDPKDTFTFRELKEFNIDFSSYYLQKGSLEGVLEYFIITAAVTYGFFLKNEANRKKFVDLLEAKIRENQEFLRNAYIDSPNLRSSAGLREFIEHLVRYGTYSDISPKLEADEIKEVRATQAAIERASQVQKPLILFTSDDSYDVVDRAFEKLINPDSNRHLFRLPMSGFTARRNFFGMYLPLSVPSDSDMKYLFERSTEEDIKQALDKVLRLEHDASLIAHYYGVWQATLKNDPAVLAAVSCCLRYQDDWEKEMKWYDGILKIIRDEARNKKDQEYFLLFENVEAMPDKVRVQFNPVLLENVVEVPELGMSISLPKNVHIVFTMHKDSEIKDPSFMDRPVRHYVSDLTQEDMVRHLISYASISQNTAETLIAMYQSVKQEKWDEAPQVLFFDIAQIARSIHGISQDPKIKEAGIIKQEFYSYLFLKLRNKRDKTRLTKLIYGKTKLPEAPSLEIKDSKLYCGGAGLKLSNEFLEFIAARPGVNAKDAIAEYTGFDVQDTERWIFSQLARTLLYRHTAVQLEGPSGEGKTEIGKTLTKLLGYKLNHFTINEDTNLSQFAGQLTPDKYGRYYISHPRYLDSARTQGNVHMFDEINTCKSLYYWLYPEITASSMKYMVEFPLQDVEEETLFRRLPIDQNNLWLFTINPDSFQGREPTPRPVSNRLIRFYMEIPQEEIPNIVTDLMLKSNGQSAQKLDDKALRKITKELGTMHTNFRRLVREGIFLSGQDITKRALIRTVEGLFQYMNQGIAVDTAFSLALEDNYVYIWHNLEDINTAIETVKKYFKGFHSSSPEQALKRKLSATKKPIFIFTNGSNKQEDVEKMIAKELRTAKTLSVALNWFTNRRQLIGGLSTKKLATEEVMPDSRIAALKDKMKIEFEMGLGIVPQLINTARTNPSQEYIAYLYNYMHLNPKVAPLLNEFFQTGKLETNGVITAEIASNLFGQFETSVIPFADNISEYNSTHAEKLPENASQFNDSQKLIMAQWFYSTLPSNLRFIAFDSSHEKQNLSPAEIDRFSPVNIAAPINEKWIEEYVNTWIGANLKALPEDIRAYVLNYVLTVYWLYKGAEENGVYKHIRLSRQDIDVFLEEFKEALARNPESDQKDLARRIGYYSLSAGFMPEYFKGQALPSDMPDHLKENFSEFLIEPLITNTEDAMQYKQSLDGAWYIVIDNLIWFKTNFKDAKEIDAIKGKFLAITESAVRRYGAMLIGIKHNRTIILEGYQGGGKTSSLEDLALKIAQPSYSSIMYEDIDIGEILGKLTIRGRKIVLTAEEKDNKGKFLIDFLNAYSFGGIYNADEGAMGKNSQELLALLQLMSELSEIDLGQFHPGLDMVIKKHPDFRLAITQNPANSTLGRSHIPYAVDTAATKIWVDNRLSEADCIRVINYYLTDSKGIPEQVKRFISRIHMRFLEEHPDRDSLSPRQLIAFSQLLNQEFLRPEASRDIASCIFQGIMNNYLSTIVSERQFYDLWAALEDVFEGDPLAEELNARLKAWQSKIVVTRTNGTIDFGGITLPVGKARAENLPKENELTYPLSVDVGSTNRALRDFALALSLGRPVALLEEDGTDVLDKIKRFCILTGWELYTLNCHYEMTRMHILDSLLPTFGEMDDYGIKTENISEGFKMALGFLSQHLIREDEYQAIKQSGDYSHKVLFFSYMDAIPERQRVMLHRLLTERKITMTDQKGERHEYVLPEWVHLAVSAPLEHKFSSPFINRFSRVAVRSTKKVSEIRAIVKSKYPNVTSNEAYWLTALAAKMYQLDKGRSFNIHYGFSINDVLYLAELLQREKQRDVDHFKTDPFYYALKAATIFYLSALEETARNKWEKDIFVSYWMKEIVFKKDKLLLDAMAKAYQKLQAQIDTELTKIEVEKVEHLRIRIDGEEINQGVLLKNGINVIKIGEVIIVQTPGNIYRIEEKELRNAKPKELSPTLHIQLLDGKNLVVICTIINSIGGYAIPRDEQTKEYALPPHEVKSRDYIEYTSSIKRQLSAMLRATAKVEEPDGRIRSPRVMIWNGESGTGKTTLERNLTAIWGISMYQLNAYEDIRVSDITAELRLEEGKFKVGVKEFLARCGKINGKRIRLSQKDDTTLKILLLDEANANPDILFALMPLFRGEKKFSVYFAGEVFEVELDSDVLLVLTFNPSERYSGRYALADELGFNAVKLWMPDPLKYTRQELFSILKEIHRRGIDKVKKELSDQVHPVSRPTFSDIRKIIVPTEKIEDISGRIVQQEQDVEIEQEISEIPEPAKPKPAARVIIKQKIKITYDKEAINTAIDGFYAVPLDARAQYFIENILEPFLYAALHHDTEDLKVERVMEIARDLGFGPAIEKLIIVYSQKIIKMSLLKPALLELRRAIVKNNYYYNIKVLIINKKPYIVFSMEGKILDRISVPPDDLDKLLRKGSSEKRNYKEWRANGNTAQTLVIDADDASIKGYFEGEFALALKKPSLMDVSDSTVPDKEKIAWVCYHELGHMFQNLIKRKSLNKNIELYSSLFPIIFSEYGLKYIKNELVNRIKIVVDKGGKEKARNDYYCQAAKAILNGFAIYLNEKGIYAELIPNFDENFEIDYVDWLLKEIEKLSSQDIKDIAVKFFKNPRKYLSTVEPGKYKIKIMRGKGGGVSVIEISGDLEEKPEIEIEDEEDMGEDAEIEVTEDDKEPEEGILEMDEETGAMDDIEDDYYSEEEAGLSGTMKKLTGMSGDLVRKFLSVFALPDQIVRLPSESGEEIDILLKIMGSLEPFIQRKRVKKEGVLSFGITIDISGSVHYNTLLKNAFTEMCDYYTSLFYLAASINKDMEFSLSAIGDYFHMLLPASECRNKEKVELALSRLWGVQDRGGIDTVEVIKGIRYKYAKTKDRPNKVEFIFTDGGECSRVGFAELRKMLNKLEEELGIDIVFIGIGSSAREVKQYNRYLYFENVPDPKDMIDAIMKLSIDKVKRGRLQSGNLAEIMGFDSQGAKKQAVKSNEPAITQETMVNLRSSI